jgi:hypothetical protein
MGKVTAGDGTPLFFLYARTLEKHTDDPSPPVTRGLESTTFTGAATLRNALWMLIPNHLGNQRNA